jgi:hemerythrin-like domain-containing protein
MSSAIAVLAHEHAAMERAAQVLGCLCERAAAGVVDVLAHHAGLALEFLTEFAQPCHDGKEAQLLLPALARRGTSSDRQAVGAQLATLQLGGQLVEAMARTQAAWAAGRRGAGARFSAAATAYHALLGGHVAATRDVLAELTDRLLGGQAQDALLEAFARFESRLLDGDRRTALFAQLDRLAAQYPPAPAPALRGL